MTSALTYALPFMVLFVLLAGLASCFLIWKRMQRRLWTKRRRNPTSSELRRRRIPVIESTPFWVPGRAGDVFGVEIQPSPRLMMPSFSSTPKPLRNTRLNQYEAPKLKFSVQYHKASGILEVQLLDAENISASSLEDEFYQSDSSVFMFADVQLSPQEKTKQRLRLMSRRRRRRHKSFEIEMSYEELQLQTLQFCVMGYDEYSRQKVIGDVLLPLAEIAQQGIDITKELVMWRDIQTGQPGSSALCERMGSLSTIQTPKEETSQPRATGKPPERRCSPS